MSQITTDHWLESKKCLKCDGVMVRIHNNYSCECGYMEDNY